MKIKLSIFSTILFFLITLPLFSQDNADSLKLAERNNAFINYDNYRSSITDTTVDILKKLINLQTDLIITDNAIIHNYINTNAKQINKLQQENQNVTKEISLIKKKYEDGKKIVFFGAIGAGIFIILTVFFVILFILTNNKKKNAINQLKKIQIIKDEQLKEINILKKEINETNANDLDFANKEKEKIENELKNEKIKFDLLSKEKNDIETKLKEKEETLAKLISKQNSTSTEQEEAITKLKEDYENKIALLNNEIISLKQEPPLFEEKENANTSNIEFNQIIEENNVLKDELNQYKTKFEKENQIRIEIENEIKQLIEEIKAIRK